LRLAGEDLVFLLRHVGPLAHVDLIGDGLADEFGRRPPEQVRRRPVYREDPPVEPRDHHRVRKGADDVGGGLEQVEPRALHRRSGRPRPTLGHAM